MQTRALLLLALVACTDHPLGSGHAVHVAGDDSVIGTVHDDGVLELDPQFLTALPGDPSVERLLPFTPFNIVVPIEDGAWRIPLDISEDCGAPTDCDWHFRTEVWTKTTKLFGEAFSYHLLKTAEACGTHELASR